MNTLSSVRRFDTETSSLDVTVASGSTPPSYYNLLDSRRRNPKSALDLLCRSSSTVSRTHKEQVAVPLEKTLDSPSTTFSEIAPSSSPRDSLTPESLTISRPVLIESRPPTQHSSVGQSPAVQYYVPQPSPYYYPPRPPPGMPPLSPYYYPVPQRLGTPTDVPVPPTGVSAPWPYYYPVPPPGMSPPSPYYYAVHPPSPDYHYHYHYPQPPVAYYPPAVAGAARHLQVPAHRVSGLQPSPASQSLPTNSNPLTVCSVSSGNTGTPEVMRELKAPLKGHPPREGQTAISEVDPAKTRPPLHKKRSIGAIILQSDQSPLHKRRPIGAIILQSDQSPLQLNNFKRTHGKRPCSIKFEASNRPGLN
jgi:hypothetical protein